MQDDPRQPGNGAGKKLLDRWRGRAGDRDRASVAAHSREPEDMDFGEGPLVTPAEAPQAARGFRPEDGSRVRDLLDLQRPGFLPWCQCLSSMELLGLCIVHIALSGTVNSTDSHRR